MDETPKFDRTHFAVGTFDDDDSQNYWRSRTPEERMAALEFMRRVMYGYDPDTARIQRVLEVVKLGAR